MQLNLPNECKTYQSHREQGTSFRQTHIMQLNLPNECETDQSHRV